MDLLVSYLFPLLATNSKFVLVIIALRTATYTSSLSLQIVLKHKFIPVKNSPPLLVLYIPIYLEYIFLVVLTLKVHLTLLCFKTFVTRNRAVN